MLGAGEDISDCRSDLGVSEGRFCGAPPNSSLANAAAAGSWQHFCNQLECCWTQSGVRVFGLWASPTRKRCFLSARQLLPRGSREMICRRIALIYWADDETRRSHACSQRESYISICKPVWPAERRANWLLPLPRRVRDESETRSVNLENPHLTLIRVARCVRRWKLGVSALLHWAFSRCDLELFRAAGDKIPARTEILIENCRIKREARARPYIRIPFSEWFAAHALWRYAFILGAHYNDGSAGERSLL